MSTYYAHPAYASSVSSSSIADAAKYCKVLEEKKNEEKKDEDGRVLPRREFQNAA